MNVIATYSIARPIVAVVWIIISASLYAHIVCQVQLVTDMVHAIPLASVYVMCHTQAHQIAALDVVMVYAVCLNLVKLVLPTVGHANPQPLEPMEQQLEPMEEQLEPLEQQLKPLEQQLEPLEPTELQQEPTEQQLEPLEQQLEPQTEKLLEPTEGQPATKDQLAAKVAVPPLLLLALALRQLPTFALIHAATTEPATKAYAIALVHGAVQHAIKLPNQLLLR